MTKEIKKPVTLTKVFSETRTAVPLEAAMIERVVRCRPAGALVVMRDGSNVLVEESFRQVKAKVTAALRG